MGALKQLENDYAVFRRGPGPHDCTMEETGVCSTCESYQDMAEELWLQLKRGRGMCLYCTVHDAGPLDVWYDCEACVLEVNAGPMPTDERYVSVTVASINNDGGLGGAVAGHL